MTNFNLLQHWYARFDVQYAIIRNLYNREFALLVPSWVKDKDLSSRSTRMLKAHNIQSIQYILNVGLRMFRGLRGYNEESTPYNFYYSIARYVNGIPNQTLNFSIRDNSEWAQNHIKQISSYDFFLDIDAGDFEDIEFSHFSTKLIINWLDKNNVPYELRFSGKGFHIIISYEYFSKGLPFELERFNPQFKDSIYSIYARIAKALSERFTDMLDLGIYDSKRVCKLPYTWANYEDDSYLCVPFDSREEFDLFELKKFSIASCSERIIFINKTPKVFNSDGNIKPLLELINYG